MHSVEQMSNRSSPPSSADGIGRSCYVPDSRIEAAVKGSRSEPRSGRKPL